MILQKVPLYKQETEQTCGASSLKMVLEYLGTSFPEKKLATLLETIYEDGVGIDRKNLAKVARSLGFVAIERVGQKIENIEKYLNLGFPVIVNHLCDDGFGHFAVVVGNENDKLVLNDPDAGKRKRMSFKNFEKVWRSYDGKYSNRWLMVVKKR